MALYQTGFFPFMLVFCCSAAAQCFVIVATVFLLQSASYLEEPEEPEEPEDDMLVEEVRKSGHGISLHALSTLFLPRAWLQFVFEFFVMVHFISILVSYGLAGPQAFSRLFHTPIFSQLLSTVAFAGSCSFIVLFLLPVIMPLLSVATAAKSVLLFLLIVTVALIGVGHGVSFTNSWKNIAEPFLMGTVAIGGVSGHPLPPPHYPG